MNSAAPSFLYSSRLVRRLGDLNVMDVQLPQSHFSEVFGQLFGLSGTIILSEMLGALPEVALKASDHTEADIKDTFLKGHAELVSFIAKGFVPGVMWTRGKLPTPADYHSHCMFTGVYGESRSDTPNNYAAAYEPFQDFYVAHQGKLAAKIHHLRSQIAGAIAGISLELAQLATLDKSIGNVLSTQSRQFFDRVPKLLGRRFRVLLDDHWQELPEKPAVDDLKPWMAPGGWVWAFCEDMRELLLAELEIRLQPVLGFIDALCEQKGPRGEK